MHGPELIVHGHFYQPPRENPWTEYLPREPSAAPFDNWNARITAESYRANAHARVLDHSGRVVSILNTYEHLSYDVGPTLLSWLEAHAPDVYARMVAADAARRGGMAQAYFHVILPLASERDQRTQIRWGLADFRHRFGREADGMWLPETAVDEHVMAVLAEEGVRFTILAPSQADGEVDTRRPYRWVHPADRDSPSPRGVDVLFFDGPISRAVAFERMSSQALVDRVLAAAPGGGLVCVATDGETFGHHQAFADRALAYALAVEAPSRGVTVTTPAELLARSPAGEPVGVIESAWSCAHGVGRWREDCGCATGGEPGWDQQWRAPLRAALDLLRDAGVQVFERRGKAALADPWAARDAYVEVLIGARSRDEFAAEHVVGDPVDAFTLLEAQRHAMAMYTSCGWFFNDLAGLETVYVLRHAARVIDLLHELGEEVPEGEFLNALSDARSNDPFEGNGRSVWKNHVVPSRVDAPRVVAHLALTDLLDQPVPSGELAAFTVERTDHDHGTRGHLGLCTGTVELVHQRTGRRSAHAYAGLLLGGLEVLGAVRPADPVRDPALFAQLHKVFADTAPATRLLRLVGEGFGPDEFDLSAALPGAADQILAAVAAGLADRFGAAYARLSADHRATLDALSAVGVPLPPEVRSAVELALARQFETEIEAQRGSPDLERYERARSIAGQARRYGVRVDTPAALAAIERTILAAVERAVDGPETPGAIESVFELHRLARELGLHPDLDAAQELVYGALQREASPSLRLLAADLRIAVESIDG